MSADPAEASPTARPEQPSPRDLLREACTAAGRGEARVAVRHLGAVVDATDELPLWLAAARVLAALPAGDWARRSLRLAVLGSHTTSPLVTLVEVAAARHGIALTTYEAPYGQYQQELLDPGSGLSRSPRTSSSSRSTSGSCTCPTCRRRRRRT